MWSGQPNGSLTAEFPVQGDERRALDIGCGEGADAIWLDKQGWQVEAVDISTLSIDRAIKAAKHHAATVDFTARDILMEPPTADRYDLITMSYPALRIVDADQVVDHLVAALRPGGELLVVGHSLDETKPAQTEEHSFDPDDYLAIDQIVARLDAAVTIKVNEKRPRPNPPAGSRHHEDHVLRVQKLTASPGT